MSEVFCQKARKSRNCLLEVLINEDFFCGDLNQDFTLRLGKISIASIVRWRKKNCFGYLDLTMMMYLMFKEK